MSTAFIQILRGLYSGVCRNLGDVSMSFRGSKLGNVDVHLPAGSQMEVAEALSKDDKKEKGLAASSEQMLLSLTA